MACIVSTQIALEGGAVVYLIVWLYGMRAFVRFKSIITTSKITRLCKVAYVGA